MNSNTIFVLLAIVSCCLAATIPFSQGPGDFQGMEPRGRMGRQYYGGYPYGGSSGASASAMASSSTGFGGYGGYPYGGGFGGSNSQASAMASSQGQNFGYYG